MVINHSGEVGCWHTCFGPPEVAQASMYFLSRTINPQDKRF
jgi:hypothetical protein